MAKKKTSSRKSSSVPKSSSSITTNSFSKGMNKDIAPSLEDNRSWWHARNAANNSEDGDLGIIGNEPANLLCGVVPYTIIGAIHRYGDEWIVFSTDDINSEIGRFDDSECKYKTLVNSQCLNFNKKYLITGASKENFDCTWEVYWDDGNNPSRALNIDDIPWLETQVSGININGEPCSVWEVIEPKMLNCEKIRLAPLVDTPCIRLEKATDGGMLQNGSYQAFIGYVENEQRVTDYIGISNIQTLWSHEGTSGSLDITLSNLDQDYFYFELVIIRRNQGQTSAKRIGLYSTEQSQINIDYIDESLSAVSLEQIPLRSPAYEKSESMFVVNDWLIRQGPTEQFDFNYQPIANCIQVNWVINEVPSTYYYLGGNKMGFMRDEQYAFFIRWIYNTGERSSSYHIPGRAPELYNGTMENAIISGANVLDTANGDPLFKVYNTGSITSTGLTESLDSGGLIIARGKMAYWESTERYPVNRPDIWNGPCGDLCGEPIRHHKMPTEEIGGANSPLHISNTGSELINILGVEFTNIGRPKYNDGTYIPNVVGYEILRGSRQGARSILAKGLFRNMREYKVPNAENLIGGSVQGLYPNHPYNDLRPDPYFHDGVAAGANNRTSGCDTFWDSVQGPGSFAPLTGYSQKVFTFASPDLMFTKPFLNAYETRLYGQLDGQSSGYFKPSEDHPQFKLLRGGAAVIGGVIGLGYAIHQIRGTTSRKLVGSRGNLTSQSGFGWFGGPAGGGNLYQPSPAALIALPISSAAANSAQVLQNLAVSALMETVTGMVDIYTGGFGTAITTEAVSLIQQEEGIVPGQMGGYEENANTKDTSLSAVPLALKLFIGLQTSQADIALGGNEIIELIYNLVKKSDFVWKFNSYGLFTNYSNNTNGLWRIKNEDSNYLGSSFQMFNSGNYKINNLFRPSTVAVALDTALQDPSVEDTSRYVVGGEINASGTANTFSDGYLLDPKENKKNPISAYYGALKYNMDNQYGQLDGIKQIQMRGCVELLDVDSSTPIPPPQTMYASKPMFAGDTFIGRYTEKVIMPMFSNFLLGQPDEFTFDYSLYVNIPYPRYWINSQRYDMTPIAQQIVSLGISFNNSNDLNPIWPDDLYYLDRGNDSCNNTWNQIFNNSGDPNPALAMEFAYMYSHTNGILDFFVETEINLDQRDWEDHPAKKIYDVYNNNDIDELFHAQIEKDDNFYKYDESLSPSKFPTQLSSFGNVQPRDYDPLVAENCFVSYPKRLIYSLQAQEESKKDYWRVFLNNNYKDFKNAVSVIKPINKSGALIFFPYLSPQMFQGLDTLKTQLDTKLTIGDGGLFSQPFQNIANADISNEYGSCESLRGVINTPAGIFFISQQQGKIFQYGGKGLDPISNQGMKWWFAKYLPSRFIKQFPTSENSVWTDNPVYGVGCQVIYDSVDDIVYFMKKDYQIKSQYISNAIFTNATIKPITVLVQGVKINIDIGDPIYFDDCSWTISYDPKAKAWISFHDWHPDLAIPSINHFFTTKVTTGTIPQCPPGYNYNPTNGLCEISVNETDPATITVDEVAATVTGGATNCLLDIVIAMDWSGSTVMNCPGNTPDYTPMIFDPSGNQIGGGVMGNACPGTAQMRWLDVFMNSLEIKDALAAGTMQIGITGWGNLSMHLDQGGLSMSTGATGAALIALYNANWNTTNLTDANAAIQAGNPFSTTGGLGQLNDKSNSSLAASYPARTQDPTFKQILIVVTDGTSGNEANGIAAMQSPNIISTAPQSPNIGTWAAGSNQSAQIDLQDATKQEIVAVFCNGAAGNNPALACLLNSISNTYYQNTASAPGCGTSSPQLPGPNQYTMSAQSTSSLEASATAIAGSVCSIPFVCTCPAGYTTVYLDSATSTYTASSGVCDDVTPPICRKVLCECPPPTIPGTVTTVLGICPDSSPEIYQIGDPNFISNRECNYFYYINTPPNYDLGGFWKHNIRCDKFVNYYNKDYPWEIDLISNTGQAVNTVRSFEYQLETYVYKGDPQYNMCGGDKWEDLDFNFDASIVYNNDQTSGLLVLNTQPVNDPWGNLTFPVINANNIDILASKVEHKFRFNQFWDITNDRGEFTNVEQSIFNTDCNGYIRFLNTTNLNYNKPPTQRKKFRHYSNQVILRRNVSGDRKMLLRVNNTKLQLSMR